MSKLKEKSEFNISAAEILLKSHIFAPSVHCSYYSCFQLIKFITKDFFGIEYEQLTTDIKASNKKTHNYIIDLVADKIIRLSDRHESKSFKNKIIDLKHYREESDYDNIEINYDKGKAAFDKAKELRQYLKGKFNT